MNLYFAPLEGITTSIYRTTHAEIFGGCDAYYAPFITPSDNEKVSKKGLKDVLPENNAGTNLKVQTLVNHAESFLKFAKKIKFAGFNEININLGCPSATVVKKGRGSGFLATPYELDKFLNDIFSECDIKISLKTRTGYDSSDEFKHLMEIYNKYPLELLIVHPRARVDFYKGKADTEVFNYAYENSKNKLCYNGDIFTKEDYDLIADRFSDCEGVMIGRGAIKNPAMFREIRGGEPLKKDELIRFAELLSQKYFESLKSETFTLHKLKEIWVYVMQNYPEEKKIQKAISKATKLNQFMSLIESLPEL